MTKRMRNVALAFLGALSLTKPHVLHTTVCTLDLQGDCPVAWCTYWGADGWRGVDFADRAGPSFCWPVRLFAFDRPQR